MKLFRALALSLSFLTVTISSLAKAQDYQKALQENKTDSPQYSTGAPDAQVEGLLRLQDPYQDIRVRKYLYRFGLKTQTFKPSGSGKIQGDSHYDLSSAGSSYLAGFEIGAVWPLAASVDYGIGAQAFFTRQKNYVTTPVKTTIDGELNTTLWSFASQLGYEIISPLRIFAALEVGQVSYAQSSQDAEARFSRQTNFWGIGGGLELKLTSIWSGVLKYTQRTEFTPSPAVAVQKDNVELGAIARW